MRDRLLQKIGKKGLEDFGFGEEDGDDLEDDEQEMRWGKKQLQKWT